MNFVKESQKLKVLWGERGKNEIINCLLIAS